MDFFRRNWGVLLMVVAIAASGYVSYTESKDTAASIATKVEKRAVSKAATIIYNATIEGCERDNARVRESNQRVRELERALGKSEAGYLQTVNCREEYKRPPSP